MKIFLCGQRSFGKEVCRAILDAGHEIVGVAPAPQRKRKDKLYGFAVKHGLRVITDCKALLSRDIPGGVDVIVSAHSHWLISDACLARAKYGGIGFHPSLLPRHRGKDAVRWAVHMGDFMSGGTVYRLTEKTDGGPILRQEPVWIRPGWDYHDLWAAIFPVGVRLIVEALRDIETGRVAETEQIEECSTWEPSWDRPRLERKELLALGGETPPGSSAKECDGCVRDCTYCTYHISDPGMYYRG